MKFRHSTFHDDGNTRVAAYESLLDLFTLISFVMILAAFIYITRSVESGQNSSSVISEIARKGTGTPKAPPKNALQVVIVRENSADRLIIKDEVTGSETRKEVTAATIKNVLDGSLPAFENAKLINVVVEDGKQEVTPDVFNSIIRWLADHRRDYHLYFGKSH
jgi:hypothetical protein